MITHKMVVLWYLFLLTVHSQELKRSLLFICKDITFGIQWEKSIQQTQFSIYEVLVKTIR